MIASIDLRYTYECHMSSPQGSVFAVTPFCHHCRTIVNLSRIHNITILPYERSSGATSRRMKFPGAPPPALRLCVQPACRDLDFWPARAGNSSLNILLGLTPGIKLAKLLKQAFVNQGHVLPWITNFARDKNIGYWKERSAHMYVNKFVVFND